MNINQNVALNLSADGIAPRLRMVQGDSNTRTIVATLWDGAQLYTIPTGSTVMLRFRKPDGTGGLYDTTEGGKSITFSGSTVTAPVATQMLAVAGSVFAELDIYGAGTEAQAEKLATFRFVAEVTPSVYPDAEIISSDYYNILTAKVGEAVAAANQAKQAQSAAAASAAAAKQSADSAAVSVEGAVKYNTAQTLTDEQKQQARDNIGAPAPYTAGENISISGSVIATKASPCNPNLLDNWYFGNPVNQKGQTSWSGLSDYGIAIDRWVYTPNTVASLTSNGVTVTADWQQYVENTRFIVGQQFTMSALTSDGRLGKTTFTFAEGINVNTGVGVGYLVIYNGQGDPRTICRIYGDGSTYLAAKLEPGSQQTLAHQENGAWVLNEIPKFGNQLAECQRYCVAFNKYNCFLPADNNDFVVELPVPMRATPTIINPQNIIDANVTNPTVAWYNIGSNQLRLRSTASHGGSQAVCNGLVLFSADL